MIQNVGKGCTGCKVCGDICPKDAISFQENSEGFWYPVVDENACIKCGKCVSCCEGSKKYVKKGTYKPLAYAAWNRDEYIRRDSTSGGIYHCFAKHVLDKGGYLIGSVYGEDYTTAYHISTNSVDDLSKIMGSKYFQSDTEGIYEKTKKLLDNNAFVLFTGTPCQVVALKNYLGKDYPNLITVDFICRGVPSPKLQKKKIELYQKKEKSKVVFYRDKSDKYAWSDFGELIRFENGREKFISRWKDDINDCFIHRNLNIRDSCYECTIKNENNASEITIGDFWGISGITEKDKKMGVSALIVNNPLGSDFISKLHETLYIEQRDIGEIKKGNPAYVSAPQRPKDRDEFFQTVNSQGLEIAVKRFRRKSRSETVKSSIKVLMAKYRKWKPLWSVKREINWLKFLKYNYFCRNIKRDTDAFLIPLRGTIIQIAKNAEVELHGNLFLNYYPTYRRGRQSTLFKVGSNGRFVINNRVEISYNNTLSIGKNAAMKMGFLFTGVGANIICNESMTFGNHVMVGRDVCIFDSDYHRILNQNGVVINSNKEVVVEDNVWIGARSMVLKGSHIEAGAIISANSMVMGNVDGNRVYINKREAKSIGDNIFWER